ncbi:glycoside hydrolase family 79 protein [Apiospora kogelbergensis]|uniref:glycoside hydrolase family 79 protein n=1 Tax=Apiospora kogelbergensis TaxID=1337665 RepID=UPI00312D50CE
MYTSISVVSLALLGLAHAGGPIPQNINVKRATQTLKVDTTKPTDAFNVPADFVGFGIESAFLNNFHNAFSANLVSSLRKRMSVPPVVRVGGTSGDRFVFDPAQKEAKTCIGLPDGGKDCQQNSEAIYRLGPSFCEGYKAFPDARMSIQAPMQESPTPLNNTLAFVRCAWDARGGDANKVAAVALGNEPNFYKGTTAADYAKEALRVQKAVIDELGLKGDGRKFFEVANTASNDNAKFGVADVLNAGINKNKLSNSAADHYYQISGKHDWTDDEMQKLMLSHRAITERLQTRYGASIAKSREAGLPFVMSETAAVLGGAPLTFMSGFGYGLWAVDFGLACMARGVSRVANLAGRPVAGRVFWVPDETGGAKNPGPQVRAPYPAAIFLADFVGKTPGAVKELDLGVKDHPYLSAYAMYDAQQGGKLGRVALVNMRLYNGTRTPGDKRGVETFRVPVPQGVQSVKVRRLHADHGAAAMGFDFGGREHNVTWAGQQWSYSVDQGKGHGKVVEDEVKVQDGVAAVNVPDSEAVIVFMKKCH